MTLQYVLLCAYCIGYVLMWYVRVSENDEHYPRVARISRAIYAVAILGMVLHLTRVVLPGASYVWSVVLVLLTLATGAEVALNYRRLMSKPEARVPPGVNHTLTALACVVEGAMQIPCMVMLYRLATTS
jgi:hypothetical protein